MKKLKLDIQLFGGSLSITASETDVDISSNTSYINLTIKATTNSTTYNDSAYLKSASITGQNDNYSLGRINFRIGKGQTVTVYSGKIGPFHHNADGSLNNVSISASCYIVSNTQPTASASVTMSTIPRASTISSISGNIIGSPTTVTISRHADTFTHKLQVVYGEKRTDWIDFGSNLSKQFTVPMDFCNSQYLSSTTNGQFIFTLVTYSNGEAIGTENQLYTMYVPDSVKPSTPSITKNDTTNNYSTYGAYVKGKSGLRVQSSANGSYGSTITNYAVKLKSGNDVLQTLNGNDVTFSGLNYTGTITIEVTATDTRNRSTANTTTISIADYANPNISVFKAERLSNDSTVTITYTASITNINNANANGKTFNIYKRQKGTSSWGSAIATYTSGYSYNGTKTETCSENYGWEFKIDAIDSYTTTSKTAEVGTAFELMNWKADGTAMAIGKVSEYSNMFEVGLQTRIKTPTNLNISTRIVPSNNGEASIEYVNSGETTGAVVGWGTGGFDGYGVWMHDIGANTLTVDRSGNINGKFWGLTQDISTNNTTDTWIPVFANGVVQHRVIDANINNAMQSTARTPYKSGSTLNGTSDWHIIGTIIYDSHDQGSFCYMKIMLGDGNNGGSNQNAWIDLYMQLGWTGSNNGRFGCYAVLHGGATNFTWSNTDLKVMTNGDTNVHYYIAVKTTITWCSPNTYAFVPNNAHFYTEDQWHSSLWGNECDMLKEYGHDIVDRGGANGYNYIKYEDGRMEAWNTISGTANITTAWGNGYTTGTNNTISLGNWYVPFTWTPDDVQVTVVRTGYNLWLSSVSDTSATYAGNVSLLRFTSQSNVAYTLNVHANGWWK